MKKLLIGILISILSLNIQAQESLKKVPKESVAFQIDSTAVSTLDSTIQSLYSVISGEKGKKRNWKHFKFLFKPEAKLIPTAIDKAGTYQLRYMTPDEYIKSSGKWLVEHGFFEKERHREVYTFGNIAHVFSSYEAFHSASDTQPFMRGINSIQLLNDGKRWWIVNVYWAQETDAHPIPKKYLP